MNEYRAEKRVQHSVQAHAAWRANLPGAWVAWTDGACEPNPDGDGGWGVTMTSPAGELFEASGGESGTTNNRMELRAIIEAIERTPPGATVVVRTDSQLCVLCATGRWKRKKNLDMWERLERACQGRSVVFEWWRGHVGTPGNERADELAGRARVAACAA